jgi:thiamine transport system substrate-binding protein
MYASSFRRSVALGLAAALTGAALAGCGNGDDDEAGAKTVTLVSHESFAASKDVLAAFTKQTGITVKVLRSGDAGAAVNQAILTKGNPQGDVFFGVDNTFLSRALKAGLFTRYRAAGLDQVPAEFQLDRGNKVTPVDYGDVCVNYDKKYFTAHKLAPPTSFEDLVKPAYKNLLVMENPATSSPGLAFLLGSVAQFGNDAFEAYWRDLRANGVTVVDSWEQAYNGQFSGGGESKGTHPLVVSYASSPPAEVAFAAKPLSDAPTGVAEGTCFRQVEFAGLLAGAKHPEAGKKLLDFLLSVKFQQDVPMQMFVFPVRKDAALPAVFSKYAARPADPKRLPADDIAASREQWIKAWTATVLK